MKTWGRSGGDGLALAAWLFVLALLCCGPARASCDAKTAQAAAAVQNVAGKFSSTARMCGDDLAVLSSVAYTRQVAGPEEHAEHLLMYDSIDIFVTGDEPQDSRGRDSRLIAGVRGAQAGSTESGDRGKRAVALMPQFQSVAQAFGIDHLLLHAIAHVESRHNPLAVSPAGAIGLMQIMPATARRFGVTRPQAELRDPKTSLQVSAAYLKTLQERFGNNLTLVVAAYNAGEGAVEKYGRRVPPYPETRNYVVDVLAMYRLLRSAASSERVAAHLYAGK